MSLGHSPVGPKTARGDGKLPEGRYVIDWRHAKISYYLSLHVSYPNTRDIARAWQLGIESGGEIMLHGTGAKIASIRTSEQMGDWTDGCITVGGSAMQEIRHAVPDGIPIEIRS